MILVAAAAMGFTACQKEMQEDTPAGDSTVQVTFVSGTPDTKTTVDTSGDTPLFAWDENETFAVLEQTDALAEASSVTYVKDEDGKANVTATFAANAGKSSYDYVTVYPASGYVSATGLDKATLSLPAVQTMAESSYDHKADLMVSEVVSADAQPTEAQMVRFTRLAAVVKMTLKNFSLEDGDKVEQVIFTADGKNLAGTVTADLADPHTFTLTEGVDNVTVNTTSSSDVYFTVLPATLEAGEAYTVTVITEKKLYIKKGTIPAEKSLVFEAGMVTRLGVNMSGIAASEKWVLVRDASTLAEGDVVAIAAKDYDKALSTKLYNNASETSTSAKRGLADVSKLDDYMIGGEDVQRLVLMTGTLENTFSFYDETRQKFLVSTTTGSTYLINQEYCNENTSFAITTAADAAATITNTTGSYAGNLLRYNTNGYFVSNQNTSTVYKSVSIYKLAGAVGTLPIVAANVTVPSSAVVIAEEGAATPVAIEEVVFNYVGDWTVTASSSKSWLTPNYADGKLYYTAESNTDAKRETTVTITASLEGQEDLTWTFNVTQKGVPQDISIADFVKLTKDENSTYRITGRITEMTTSSSGTFKLTDGTNVATVTYLYTDAGVKVYGDNPMGLKVGDVMTVTTVPVGSGKGGNSSHHSIYKGHYGLKTTAGLAADYTGGNVEISIETYSNGNIEIPEAVEATMAENDFAELSYSGGNTAIVSFTSENETSDSLEAEVTFTYGMISVTVVAEQGVNPANRVGWNLVTDASTLAKGDEIVIVAKNSDKALGCLASTAVATSVSNFPAVEVDKSGNVVYDVEKAGALVFTIVDGNSDNTFALQFTHNDANYFLYAPSSGLKGRAASSGANAATSYEIAIDSDNGVATIKNGQPKLVMFNGAASGGTTFLSVSPTSSNAAKAEYAVAIYKK